MKITTSNEHGNYIINNACPQITYIFEFDGYLTVDITDISGNAVDVYMQPICKYHYQHCDLNIASLMEKLSILKYFM